MIRGQKVFLGVTIGLWLLIFCLYASANDQESVIDIPRDQVQEYRALEAEARVIRAEGTLSLHEIEKRKAEILEIWKQKTGGSLEGWEIDVKAGQLKKINRSDEK